MFKLISLSGCIWMFLSVCQAPSNQIVKGNLSIAPLPASMIPHEGEFVINQNTWIRSDTFNSASFDAFKVFHEVFKKKSGYTIPIKNEVDVKANSKNLILIIHSPMKDNKEGYRLSIKPDGITISAATEQGLFYAFLTLRQIMRLDAVPDADVGQREWAIPAVDIIDEPSFPYRGLHLDVCRHFMPVDFVKKYIDLLAYYKMNRFHWHLTEDQGWRIEIKKYPKLQEIAAWRDETLIGHYSKQPKQYDGKRHGGFYTQVEVKEVVAYAMDRGVTIIPEIEMPGHALAALSAYPELGCTPGPFKAATTWGVFEDVFCPNEVTFTFLQDVLDEVMSLFPSPYIHIGGDECPKTRWKQSAFCQALIKKEGLKDEHELQSYFIRRIEKYVNSKGRNIIGWDEIMEGGLAPNATVMSWRGMKGGTAAAKAGHDVIMTPGSHCYFDYYQADQANEPVAIGGLITLEKVYSFHPVPAVLSKEEAKHILGAQGNLWTEYIATPAHAEYMAYPRAIALAEVLWTPDSMRNWVEFVNRLEGHSDRLNGMNVNYAKHLRSPKAIISSSEKGLSVIWKTDLPNQKVMYTLDTAVYAWNMAMSGDTTLFSNAGSIFYKTDLSSIVEIKYQPSKTKEAKISSNPPPSSRYPGRQGIQTLADGMTGKVSFNGEDWCAWETPKMSIILTFDTETEVDSVSIGFLSSPASWIYLPVMVAIYDQNPKLSGRLLVKWTGNQLVTGRQDLILQFPNQVLKELVIEISPLNTIPDGKAGAGHTPWTFIDEIRVE